MGEKEYKELFAPVTRNDEGENIPEAGPVRGYFSAAWRRLLGMRASALALSVIAVIILFSLLVPLFGGSAADIMDPYYAKMGPRISYLASGGGPFGGSRERRVGERGLIKLLGIGVGAMDTEGAGVGLGDAFGEKYTPVRALGEKDGLVQAATVDSYLEVGFIYKTVEREEYERIVRWQQESGVRVLYPLVNENEYNPDPSDANSWYLANSRSEPLGESGGEYYIMSYDENMVLLDNYMRGSDGELIYAVPSGGGNNQTAGVKIRVLYYNYYLYLYGREPNYLLGTDSQGYDLALRMAGGIRTSLLIALFVSVINFIIGAFVGAIEGYYGGAVDLVIERVTDVLSGVPFIVVATLFQIYLSDRLGALPSLLFAFVLTGWLGTANRVRAQFYRFKNREYVMAARTLGARDSRIIWRHIFPNTLGTLITASALVIPSVIFSESMLSFLGIVNFGAEGGTSLGTLLADASGVWMNYPHLMLFPAMTISLLMIAFNILGNGLRDAFNPKTADA